MIDNDMLAGIRDRRSVRNFTSDLVSDDHIEAILEAARWAPSGANSQPWDFVVVQDPRTRTDLGRILKGITFSWAGMAAAPVMIVVSVDQTADPTHFVEDGAVAAQNVCLAAQSLGLASSWAGVFSNRKARKGAEGAIADLVSLPETHRVIAVVPIGVARNAQEPSRRPLAEMVHYERYSPQSDSRVPAPSVTDAYQDDSTRGLPAAAAPQPQTRPGRFA